MSFNGSGVFQRLYNWVNDANAGIKILSTRMDAEDTGFATGLSNCICKDGQTTITADLPMANFKFTGVGNAALRNQFAAVNQVQDSVFLWGGTAGGTANAITITLSPAILALVAGQTYYFLASASNTGTTTLAINGLTATNIKRNISTGLADLLTGDIISGFVYEVVYDGTYFQLINRTPLIPPIQHSQTFTSSGTFTAPTGTISTTLFKFIVTGGGGGGGTAGAGSSTPSTGGGGGGTAIYYATGLSAGTGYTVTVGAGGAGGAANSNGSAGGTSSVVIGGTTVQATGGGGGTSAGSSPLGTAGVGSSGTINLSGGQGGPCVVTSGAASGVNGDGGTSYWGPGTRGKTTGASAYSANTNYGAGGAGQDNGSSQTGQAGVGGLVLVEWVL